MSLMIPTPHIEAKKGDFAKTVLMPGDPLRAKFIADTYLQEVRTVNRVRGMLGFTGKYKGKEVSVMASGMGMPSMGIYSYELFHGYDVENIIRIGTACSMSERLNVKDLVIAMGACTDTNFASQFRLPGCFAPTASYKLLSKAVEETKKRADLHFEVGNVYSHDAFYDESGSTMTWAKMGVLAVEMETAGLYMTAARAGKHALAICTISDSMVTGEETTSAERQTTFHAMMEIALEIA